MSQTLQLFGRKALRSLTTSRLNALIIPQPRGRKEVASQHPVKCPPSYALLAFGQADVVYPAPSLFVVCVRRLLGFLGSITLLP